jgi:hypothetical protein
VLSSAHYLRQVRPLAQPLPAQVPLSLLAQPSTQTPLMYLQMYLQPWTQSRLLVWRQPSA